MISLLYFIVVFFILLILKNRSIALVLLGIQIVSLIGTFFLVMEYSIDTFFKMFNLAFTLLVLSMIIIPWMKVVDVKEIYIFNDVKLKRLTHILIGLSIIPFLVFLVVSYFVLFLVEDINIFKYAEGVSTDFYYGLPINIRLLIFSNYIYNLSYFLIPLHFYYLSKKNYWLSFFCFLFSLNIILYGVTYFSRSVYIHYSFIYGAFLYILYPTLEYRTKKNIKFLSIISVIIFITYFIYISNERFEKNKAYDYLIPTSAIVQDPVYYSYLDYSSQWYFNNLIVLENYNFKGFNGQISFQPVLSILGQYGLINYDSAEYTKLRIQLWPNQYWTFNGFVAYSVYDYGYFLSFLFCICYFYFVRFNSPINKSISVFNLFVLVLLIQLPLMSIFYSNVGALIIPLIFLIPIYLYLKLKVD